jgi:hypothetical protein
MQFVILADAFDGETEPGEDAVVVEIEPGVFQLSGPAGEPLEAVGVVPWLYVTQQLGQEVGQVLFVSADPTATSATFGVLMGGTRSVYSAAWDPSDQLTAAGWGIPSLNYSLLFETDLEGEQTIMMEIVPRTIGELVAPVDPTTFGPATDTADPWLPWSATELAAAGALELGRTTKYDAAAGYAITIPVGEDNDMFAIFDTTGDTTGVTLTPTACQIEGIDKVAGATALVNIATFYGVWRFDASAGAAGVWRFLGLNML